MWAGDPDEGESATRSLRELAAPLVDLSGPVECLDAWIKAAYDPDNRFRLNQNITPLRA